MNNTCKAPPIGANASGPTGFAELWCWRHPRAESAAGRCIGVTDLPVDRRRARRLAHRIRQAARRHGLPRQAAVSPLRRCRDVGRWLRRWGWRVTVDQRLRELDFGRWDGQRWSDIAWAEVTDWEADLLHHAPGGGETLAALALRVHGYAADVARGAAPCIVLTHGGWMNALRAVPPGTQHLASSAWPAPPPCAGLLKHALGRPDGREVAA